MSNAEIVRRKLNELAERSNEISRREVAERKTVLNKEHLKEMTFEKKWRDLGVLGLFEELRDSGVITMSTREPATIHVDKDSCEIRFDERWFDTGNSDNLRRSCSYVVTIVDEQKRILMNGVPVTANLEEAVAIAIAKKKGFRGV